MKRNKNKWIAGLFAAAVLCILAGTAIAAPEPEVEYTLMAGAAERDIAPTEENGMLPIVSKVGRTTAEGVIDELHTRVIAVNDGEKTGTDHFQ